MYISDVIKYCESHGKKFTRMGLYTAGKKYGFVFKVEGKHSYVFDQEKFLEWFEGVCEEVPEGWISVKEFATKHGYSLSKAYSIVNSLDYGVRRIGSGKGVLYVDERRVEKVVEQGSNKHTYDWSKKDD